MPGQADADIVVVGAGMAGWTAARRAQELGLRVVIVDKGPPPGSSNTRMAMGFLGAAYLSMYERPEILKAYASELTSGVADDRLLNMWAANCRRAVDWLAGQGTTIGRLRERADFDRLYLDPLLPSPPGLAEFGRARGPDLAMTRHSEVFATRGGRYVGPAAATSLTVGQDGRVTGVRIATPRGEDEIKASAVVLADGGFQANEAMIRRHVGPHAHQMKLRSLGTQSGDGIAMGVAVGAATVNMQYFYGHMLSLDAVANDNLWPYPTLDQAICDGILVGRDGRRFTDEQAAGTGATRDALSGVAVANVVGRSADPRGAIAIGDHRRPDPAIAAVLDAGGTVWRADDLTDLARQAGIDAQRLADTVAGFNAAAEAGRTACLGIPRQGSPAPVAVPPFYAVPCVAAITYTLGGLRISPQAQVLTAGGRPVPGLYAAGATAGGIGGGPRGGYLGGLGTALVLGLAAAEHIAASAAAAR